MLDARGAAVPAIVHWGGDLGPLSEARLAELADSSIPPAGPSSTDEPTRVRLVPLLADGWSGQPGLQGRHLDAAPGRTRRPALYTTDVSLPSPTSVRVHLEDTADGDPVLAVDVDIELSVHGVLRSRTTVTNLALAAFDLTRVATSIPVPAAASEQLDFTGTWAHERQPQRAAIRQGTWLRESRHGRGGHDDAFVLAVGTPGFGFRTGEVWAFHLATSGDTALWFESTATGHTVAGLCELLEPGEVQLQTGESYVSPWSMASWSRSGLDGVAERFHGWFRSLPAHPSTPRPLTLNTWEAVYFEHDETGILALAEAAASIGVERFVLDDGWMTDRIDDSRALGNWTVDGKKWPRGLGALVSRVTDLGMQFGLWVEPEMVSLDSELARAHPEWVLREHSTRLPLAWRKQHVLDFGTRAVRDHVIDAVSALLTEYDISYLKWDMNRDLLGGSVHAHVAGLYEVLDRLRELFPHVEIESCSSGGARIDGAILERVQRVWPSDTNDPLERLTIERWTALLVPPEYLGSHVGAGTAHTTGRTHSLSFRLAVALFGHAGIEWDVSALTDKEHEALTKWASLYRDVRALVHSGTVVNGDSPEPRYLRGVVAVDYREALYCVANLGGPAVAVHGPDRLPGLDQETDYRVELVEVSGKVSALSIASGGVLATTGVVLPLRKPESAVLVRCTAL